jgi:hypothetical protein
MKKLLLILFLFESLTGVCQTGNSINNAGEKKGKGDTGSSVLIRSYDSLLQTNPAFDSIQFDKDMERNISGLVEMQNTRRNREKRNAMIRIGIGVAFLIVLVIGLSRKKVKK